MARGGICPYCECNLGKLFPGRKQKEMSREQVGNLEERLELEEKYDQRMNLWFSALTAQVHLTNSDT